MRAQGPFGVVAGIFDTLHGLSYLKQQLKDRLV
jgi:hypothetical protein